ncbi:hypothetical protein DPMN_059665 [Dreissena polymorpha]|uniref:Uncharacterized protein n=1 Tax=Dreissena polymorpha TaxID=45954 RepID=A0A9D4HHG2_DREPO|nr:hypothetical protein DPMN_059665 [Dreissena polymorpha]
MDHTVNLVYVLFSSPQPYTQQLLGARGAVTWFGFVRHAGLNRSLNTRGSSSSTRAMSWRCHGDDVV